MIKKTILTTVVLLLLHIVYRDLVRPDIVISQAEWQNTHIVVEGFLYSKQEYESIIVGSSIARRINTDSLSGFLNLSFEGNAAYAGMDLIFERGNKLPKRIFVETNLLYKTSESTIDKNNSLITPLKKYVPALRDGKQPLPLLEAYLESKLIGKIIPYQFNIFSSYNPVNNTLNSNQLDVMRAILASQEGSSSTDRISPSDDLLAVVVNRLLPYVEKCRANGIDMIFFQVPSEGTYKFATETGNIIKKEIKYQHVHYLPYPDNDTVYETTDNWHLDHKSAQLYTSFFKQKSSSIFR